MATDSDLNSVKSYIGDTEISDAELRAMIDGADSWHFVAQSILRRRRANLLDGPASVSATGYSESNVATIEGLTRDLEELSIVTGQGGTSSPVTTSQLTRADRQCR